MGGAMYTAGAADTALDGSAGHTSLCWTYAAVCTGEHRARGCYK